MHINGSIDLMTVQFLISFIEWAKVNKMRDKFLIDFSLMGRKVNLDKSVIN
jgi:hypothetical protein